jgi:hypothetical protein
LLTSLVDRYVAENSAAFSALGAVAGDVWKGWVGVFTSPVAPRAILLPFRTPHLNSKDDSTAAATSTTKSGKREMAGRKRRARVDHATTIVSIFLEARNLPWTGEESERFASAQLRLAAALVGMRLLEYKVPVTLKGWSRCCNHKSLFVAFAKATIAKGEELNELEVSAIADRAVSRRGGAALA